MTWNWLSMALLTLAVCVTVSACGPIMIDHDGSRVFNPAYVRFLESHSRDRWQKPDDVIAALEVQTGAIVADVGAGGGYFTRRFADQVGPSGLVYATDVQEAMVRELNKRVIDKGYENVEIVQSEARDPMLPLQCCDLIFFAAVYKEIQDRNAYLAHVRDALKPNGRVALIGFPPDGSRMGPPKEVRLSVERVVEEFSESGFTLTQTHDFLPMQYFLVFEKAAMAHASSR